MKPFPALYPLLCALALAAASISPAQAGAVAGAETGAWAPVLVPAARQFDLRAASGHAYRLFVSRPAFPVPANGFPVLYVLDGNAAFPVAAFLARSAASRSEVTGHVPPIVVGIGYPGDDDFDVPARRRDYTPGTPGTFDAADADGSGASEGEPSEGGAARFLDFIEGEVKPLIEAAHPVDRSRQAIFGHSFGGLFVLHALFTRPGSFSTFIASSPSIWWQNKALLGGLPALLQGDVRPRVQISVGALEDDPPKGRYTPEMRAMIASRSMLPPARELVAKLSETPGWANKVVYHELPGEDHGPVWLPALSRGLQFFLEQP
ncbi:putative esterase [Sterolibacterium denitrificans]|uniref:Esterase n=1 Tax=Sterolibacterium denitrificans TaxID=157592 RepID=A0A7Z7HRU1_9PROT|nr:alpha/beta hydrolase-fold protein [Sterolibacterium denitrificans]SMB28137.1 putative esterase [Sterolibacterium denitrificans]